MTDTYPVHADSQALHLHTSHSGCTIVLHCHYPCCCNYRSPCRGWVVTDRRYVFLREDHTWSDLKYFSSSKLLSIYFDHQLHVKEAHTCKLIQRVGWPRIPPPPSLKFPPSDFCWLCYDCTICYFPTQIASWLTFTCHKTYSSSVWNTEECTCLIR